MNGEAGMGGQQEVDWLAQARAVIEQVELGNADDARRLVETLSHVRETELFQEIGKLTRELHDALDTFHMDSRLTDLASRDIPDAKARLNHVIALTEQAAHRTLSAVEAGLPAAAALSDDARRLQAAWQRFRARDMSAGEFRALARDMDAFLGRAGEGAEAVRAHLSEILMAQDFQDLTGQVIRRVINLVQDVEESLIGLLRVSGERLTEGGARPREGDANAAAGPVVPGIDHGDVINGQDDVDDLLSSLGF